MKKLLKILAVVLIMAMLASCSSNPIVGKWGSDSYAYEFNKDDTGVEIFHSDINSFKWNIDDGILIINYDDTDLGTNRFKYSIENETLTLTWADYDDIPFSSFEFPKK